MFEKEESKLKFSISLEVMPPHYEAISLVHRLPKEYLNKRDVFDQLNTMK